MCALGFDFPPERERGVDRISEREETVPGKEGDLHANKMRGVWGPRGEGQKRGGRERLSRG